MGGAAAVTCSGYVAGPTRSVSTLRAVPIAVGERIAATGDRLRRHDRVQPLLVVGADLDARQRDVLLEIAAPLRARDRYDVLTAAQHPREGELAGCAALLGGEVAHRLDETQVRLEVLALEPRVVLAEVIRTEVLG